MKYTFIGDIHGKVDCVEEALTREGKKIFVGDIADSFDKTPAEHDKCFQLILDACENGDVICLYGNHELSYTHGMRCSGYSSKMQAVVEKHYKRIRKLFSYYHAIPDEDILITHAGLTLQLWNEYGMCLDPDSDWYYLNILDGWVTDRYSPAYQIGRYRGGPDDVGGIFWCDFNAEFKGVPELMQIFGHTRKGEEAGIRQRDEINFCIDCLDWKMNFLEIEIDDTTIHLMDFEG